MTNSKHQQYCLRWNNHLSNFASVMNDLLQDEVFTDMSIAVDDGTTIKCHKMVLAASSNYFQDLFIKNPCDHPMVILSDVKYHEIRAILDYMYSGEVSVAQEDLQSLLKIGRSLKVKGLIEEDVPSTPEYTEADRESASHSLPMLANAAAVAAAAAAAANSGSPLTNGYASPPPSHVSTPFGIPFSSSSMDLQSAMSVWPTLLQQMPHLHKHPISGHQPPLRSSFLPGSYDPVIDNSPLVRKKMSSYMANRDCRDNTILRNVLSGQNDSSLNDRHETYSNNNSNGSFHESERRNSSEQSEPMAEDEDKPTTPQKYSSHKEPKPEWKRYKQYTRQHIVDAMTAVRNKDMSALQAASKYGIPSRTLYDKLKKAGILPTRGAGVHRASRSDSLCSTSARFPYSSSMNGSVYGNSGTVGGSGGGDGDGDGAGGGAGGTGNGTSDGEGEANSYTENPTTSTSLVVRPRANSSTRGNSIDDTDTKPVSNNGQTSSNEDGAEDLSVGSRRSSDHSVIVPPSAPNIKQEDETGM